MTVNSYRQALGEARAELSELNQDFEKLRRRKDQLESAIACLVPLAMETGTLDLDFADYAVREADDANARKSPNGTRDLIIAAIKSAKKPLTVPQIHRYAAGIMPQAAPKAEAIRILMRRRTDTFESLGDGLYTLREWMKEATAQSEIKNEDWKF